MARYGISLSSFDQSLLEMRSSIEALPNLGYGDLWAGESHIHDWI